MGSSKFRIDFLLKSNYFYLFNSIWILYLSKFIHHLHLSDEKLCVGIHRFCGFCHIETWKSATNAEECVGLFWWYNCALTYA